MAQAGSSRSDCTMPIYFKQSPWTAVQKCAENDGIALTPFDSLEQHGPRLPCGTDTFKIDQIIAHVTSQVGQPLPACVHPTTEYRIVKGAPPWTLPGGRHRGNRCTRNVPQCIANWIPTIVAGSNWRILWLGEPWKPHGNQYDAAHPARSRGHVASHQPPTAP